MCWRKHISYALSVRISDYWVFQEKEDLEAFLVNRGTWRESAVVVSQ
jgi:hypothetical protein